MLKYPRYRDIETRYKLSPSHFAALGYNAFAEGMKLS